MINTVFENMHISKNSLIAKLPYQLQIILAALHNITHRTDAIRIPLKELQKENARLKRAVANLTVDKLILEEAAKGNF